MTDVLTNPTLRVLDLEWRACNALPARDEWSQREYDRYCYIRRIREATR